MRTVLLPPVVNPIAVNKYILSYPIKEICTDNVTLRHVLATIVAAG